MSAVRFLPDGAIAAAQPCIGLRTTSIRTANPNPPTPDPVKIVPDPVRPSLALPILHCETGNPDEFSDVVGDKHRT